MELRGDSRFGIPRRATIGVEPRETMTGSKKYRTNMSDTPTVVRLMHAPKTNNEKFKNVQSSVGAFINSSYKGDGEEDVEKAQQLAKVNAEIEAMQKALYAERRKSNQLRSLYNGVDGGDFKELEDKYTMIERECQRLEEESAMIDRTYAQREQNRNELQERAEFKTYKNVVDAVTKCKKDIEELSKGIRDSKKETMNLTKMDSAMNVSATALLKRFNIEPNYENDSDSTSLDDRYSDALVEGCKAILQHIQDMVSRVVDPNYLKLTKLKAILGSANEDEDRDLRMRWEEYELENDEPGAENSPLETASLSQQLVQMTADLTEAHRQRVSYTNNFKRLQSSIEASKAEYVSSSLLCKQQAETFDKAMESCVNILTSLPEGFHSDEVDATPRTNDEVCALLFGEGTTYADVRPNIEDLDQSDEDNEETTTNYEALVTASSLSKSQRHLFMARSAQPYAQGSVYETDKSIPLGNEVDEEMGFIPQGGDLVEDRFQDGELP